MKCPNCGAEIKNGSRKCDFCGSEITLEMKKKQEVLNKQGCPKCNSSNIKFEREKQGEIKGKKGTRVVRKTVGFCKDCGYTWNADGSTNTSNAKKKGTNWWVIGWIFCFPIPAMILIWRKKNTWSIKVKVAVTVVFWILLLVIAASNDSSAGDVSRSNSSSSNIKELSYSGGKNEVTVNVGEVLSNGYVNAKVKSSKDFSPQDVVFVSNNPEIAEIVYTKESLTTYLYYDIVGVSAGETYVYAMSVDGDVKTEAIHVIVPEPPEAIVVSEIAITDYSNILVMNESTTVGYDIVPANAEKVGLTWTSSDENVAIVDDKGIVSAVGEGTAIITVTDMNGAKAECNIDVDGSKSLMYLRTSHIRQDDTNIGSEWSYDLKLNGEKVTNTFVLSVGDNLSFSATITEADENPDIGNASATHIVTEDDLKNGFEVAMDVYVTENGGRNSGKSAYYVVKYTFSVGK